MKHWAYRFCYFFLNLIFFIVTEWFIVSHIPYEIQNRAVSNALSEYTSLCCALKYNSLNESIILSSSL